MLLEELRNFLHRDDATTDTASWRRLNLAPSASPNYIRPLARKLTIRLFSGSSRLFLGLFLEQTRRRRPDEQIGLFAFTERVISKLVQLLQKRERRQCNEKSELFYILGG